jgi:hypothetical protein
MGVASILTATHFSQSVQTCPEGSREEHSPLFKTISSSDLPFVAPGDDHCRPKAGECHHRRWFRGVCDTVRQDQPSLLILGDGSIGVWEFHASRSVFPVDHLPRVCQSASIRGPRREFLPGTWTSAMDRPQTPPLPQDPQQTLRDGLLIGSASLIIHSHWCHAPPVC